MNSLQTFLFVRCQNLPLEKFASAESAEAMTPLATTLLNTTSLLKLSFYTSSIHALTNILIIAHINFGQGP